MSYHFEEGLARLTRGDGNLADILQSCGELIGSQISFVFAIQFAERAKRPRFPPILVNLFAGAIHDRRRVLFLYASDNLPQRQSERDSANQNTGIQVVATNDCALTPPS